MFVHLIIFVNELFQNWKRIVPLGVHFYIHTKTILIMARFSSIALGKATGSIGNVTFTVQRGQNIAKAKPVSVANPQTAKQTLQRSRFSDASNYAKHIASFLQQYHKPVNAKFSPRNSFMNSMLQLGGSNAFTPATVATLPILYANGVLSLPSFTHETAPSYTNGDKKVNLDISWSSAAVGQDTGSDMLKLVVVNVTTGVVQEIANSDERASGVYSGSLFGIENNEAYVIVAMFVSDDGLKSGIGYPIASVVNGVAAGYSGGNNSNMPF